MTVNVSRVLTRHVLNVTRWLASAHKNQSISSWKEENMFGETFAEFDSSD